MCIYVSNIVAKANQSGTVSLFRRSFEREEILTGSFSSLMVYHRKIISYEKQNAMANWASIKDST